jgi:hypothetical protein
LPVRCLYRRRIGFQWYLANFRPDRDGLKAARSDLRHWTFLFRPLNLNRLYSFFFPLTYL